MPVLKRILPVAAFSALTWLVFLSVYAGLAKIDLARRGRDMDFSTIFQALAIGYLPWLLLFPVVFLTARHHHNLPLPASLLRTAGLALASFGVLVAYLLFAFAPLTGQSAGEAVNNQQIVQWLSDAALFAIVYLAGRSGARLPARGPVPARRIAVRSPDRVDFLPVEAIDAVSAQGNYVALVTRDGDVLHRATLAEMEDRLAGDGFLKIHRSHIVRVSAIRSAAMRGSHPRSVTLDGDRPIPVSDRYAGRLAEALETAETLSSPHDADSSPRARNSSLGTGTPMDA